ncbi:MAG: hypothetical protein M4D80_21855 [Myxococcota bacterium]|nr:hypothetical protein [Deltaproteobacteria bacterium]MDQ3337814.1 hypothetical protein [Myxococcota bacterium]
MKKLISLSFALIACGDNNGTQVTPDSTPLDPDAAPFVAPTPVAVPIATAGTDQLLGAVAASSGGFYAVGFRAATHEATADRETVLVKIDGMGKLDTSFSGDGIASINVQTGGAGETFRGIVLQPNGKIVVSGIVEDEAIAADRDVALVRFNTDGTPDTTFGTAGIVRLDLNAALGTMGADATWGLVTDASGRIYVHAAQRTATLDASNADTLTDTDFVIVRLAAADGAVDTTFATLGKFTLDIQRSSANVRSIHILGDGSILASGYAGSTSTGNTLQPVIYKLTPGGVLDAGFASGGLFHEIVLTMQTEVYGMAIQPDGKIVTAGYGRNAGAASNDWISLRLTPSGVLDTTWANQGKYLLDPTGTNDGDNCRNVIALPGGRTALFGSGGPTNMTSDAYIVILDSTGKPDTAFGTGIMKFELGSNDALFGGAAATNGMRAMFTGFRGGGATPSPSSNDDSYVVSLSLP